MTTKRDVYLVVVSVLEGRNFPKRPKHRLAVECRFDGELLSTDPVDHTECPDFTTELAWELDRKALHQHRMQRTPIKLQCFAVNISNEIREQVGYVLLDLRLAQQNIQAPKWYNLLSSKYSRLKPAIKVGMMLEDDPSTEQNAFKAQNAPPRAGKALSSGDVARELAAHLNDDEGYFQIGPPENCYEMFILSVTIAFATNLEQLIPSDKPLPYSKTGYFFYYTLLGNDVANDPFPDLLSPEFVPEKASVRIKSSVEFLRLYFGAKPGIQVHLCAGDQSLGNAEIPLNGLLKKGSREIDIKPVITEGPYTLYPVNAIKQQTQGGLEAKVGVSVSLRREEILSEFAEADKDAGDILTADHLRLDDDVAPLDAPERDSASITGKLKEDKTLDQKSREKDNPNLPAKPLSPDTQIRENVSLPSPSPERKLFSLDTDEEADSIHSEPKFMQKKSEDLPVAKDSNVNEETMPGLRNKQISVIDPVSTTDSSALTTTATHPVVPPQARHYRFSLHLKSVADLDLPFTCNAFLKYTYPFFGSAAPVLTNPPVEIKKKIETTLPCSLCTFDFACTAALLHNTFNSVPLIVELWHRDKKSTDTLLATAAVPLPLLMTQEPIRFALPNKASSNDREGIRLTYHMKMQMMSLQGPKKKVADVNVSLMLEDIGSVREQKFFEPQKQPNEQSKQKPRPPPKVEEPRQTAEYQTAMELELWKEQQEQEFENQLREKEIAHMRALAEEWQRRDKEREALVAKRVNEYNKLETKLRKSLSEIEAREKKLTNNELELARIRADVQRERERVLAQAQESTNRMKEDCVHQVQLEKGRIRILEEENSKLRSHLSEAERKFSALEQKFQDFKIEQSNTPAVRLQSELQLLTLEKNELERKLESVNKSKLHYKQQWGRALKELARLKNREQEHAMANLKRQQEELEQMRMRHFADEEREASKEGKRQLLEIKEELDRLKAKDAASQAKTDSPTILIGTSQGTMDQTKAHFTIPRADEHIDEHVARLVEERDTLLRTGVYTRQDRIISELDRQIRDAISRKSNVTKA